MLLVCLRQQVENIGDYINNSETAKEFEAFGLALDENNDTSDTSQLLVII
jgi:hypothetical protein